MAKRRLSDSTSQLTNHQPLGPLSLGFLLLLTSLISVNCASLTQQPKSRFSLSPDSDDSLIGHWAPSPVSHIGYKDLPLEPAASAYESTAGRQQQRPSADSNSINDPALSLAEDRQKFYHQLQLLADSNNNYYDNQNVENLILRPASTEFADVNDRLAYDQSSAASNDYDLPHHQSASLPAYYFSPSLASSTNNYDVDREKLLELLSASRNDDDDNDNNSEQQLGRQLSEDYRYLVEPKPKQHISLYLDAAAPPADETLPLPVASTAAVDSSAKNEQQKNFAYQIGEDQQATDGTEKRSQDGEKSTSESSNATTTTTTEAKANIPLTTLLDEDEDLGTKDADNRATSKSESNRSSSSDDDNLTSKQANSTSGTAEALKDHTTVSYGKVVTKQEDTHQTIDGSLPSTIQATGAKISSLLSGLYHLVADNWPASLSIASSSSSNSKGNDLSKSAPNDKTEEQPQLKATIDHKSTTTFSKPSVSETAYKSDMVDDKQEQKQAGDNWSIEENNDKRTSVPSSSSDKDRESSPVKQAESTAKRESKQQQTGGHEFSLLKQSTNLMMPFKSSDELVVESASSSADYLQQQPPLPGRYIYAPEHHYHLSSASSFADPKRLVAAVSAAAANLESDDVEDDGQMFAGMSQRSGPRSIHAGDNVYAGTFSGLRPFYAASSHLAADDRNDRLNMANNKSNDIYFLVMVAAFCSMAMAVVLAAGLFAYRVQQNRKSTSEADYPTYGVVGPNNMNGIGPGGKCGAASFVGGYFAGMGGPGSSSSGSNKSGSVKQLADMYSIGADSGISTGAGGVKSSSASGKRVILASEQAGGQMAAAPGGANNNNNNSGQARFANQNAARMFHYQHQKQQMIISDRSSNGRHTSASDLDSEDENDENSYTVYECPGLASAHEMEIKNPLFNDDQTP